MFKASLHLYETSSCVILPSCFSHMQFLNKMAKCLGPVVFCSALVKCGSSSLLWNATSVVCSFVRIALAKNTRPSECNLKNKPFPVRRHNLLKALREVSGHYFLASPSLFCTLFQRKLSSPFKANLSFTIVPVSLTSQYLCFLFQRPEAFMPFALEPVTLGHSRKRK